MMSENDPLKVSDLSNHLKKNYNTVKKYLEILNQLQIITTITDKKRILFKLNLNQYYKCKELILGEDK